MDLRQFIGKGTHLTGFLAGVLWAGILHRPNKTDKNGNVNYRVNQLLWRSGHVLGTGRKMHPVPDDEISPIHLD
jgi:hypothetical protein